MERHVPRGGGNSLKPSHNHGLWQVGVFNNLALWGEKKFISELKRTYKFKRGVNRHTEDNSPKYRMVGEILSILRSFAVQTRIFAKECNIIAEDYVRSTAQDDENLNRLRNKCAMTCDLFPRPFGERVRERGYLAASLLSRLAAFTLAEVLITLGIIGVVSAMTVPTLMQNYQRQSYVTQLHKVYNEFSQASLRFLTDRNALNLAEAGLTDINAIDSFMKTYFKIVKDCGDDINACFPNNYKKVDGTSFSPLLASSNGKNYILANGAAVYILKYGSGAQIQVDVNGKKGPNIVGRDIFAMVLYNNGMLDDGCGSAPCTTEEREELFNTYCIKSSGNMWWGCLGKILNDNWQMNY